MGEKHQCVVASHVEPAGDLACNPGMCPDQESNQRPFGLQPVLIPLSYTSQGFSYYLLSIAFSSFVPNYLCRPSFTGARASSYPPSCLLPAPSKFLSLCSCDSLSPSLRFTNSSHDCVQVQLSHLLIFPFLFQ